MLKYLEKEDNFNDLIKDKDLLIDFYADWCGPCKMLSPILEEIDFIDVLKINVDEFNNLATSFGVMSIPALIVMKKGKVVNTLVGYHNLDEIKKIVE